MDALTAVIAQLALMSDPYNTDWPGIPVRSKAIIFDTIAFFLIHNGSKRNAEGNLKT